jgi:hypothetical protein
MEEDEEGTELRSAGLLSRLHRFYRPGRSTYEKEDLFTEYLAWLLHRSARFRIKFAKLALDDSADMSPELFSDAKALTQVDTGGRGRIDLVLEVDAPTDGGASGDSLEVEARLGIEVKVDAWLGEEQPRRYQKWLEEEAEWCRHVALAVLTKKRLGQQCLFEGDEPSHWQGRTYWHEVEEKLGQCVDEVRSDRLAALDPEEDDFLASAGFVVIGDELRALMREEGMVAAEKIDAVEIADRYREYDLYKDQIDDILGLVENALDTAGIETLLEQQANVADLRREHKKNRAKGRPVSILYHREDPPATFMFGVLVSPPNRYTRRPGETFDSERYEAELIAAYKMHDRTGGALQMPDGLEKLTATLTDGVRDRWKADAEVFVPENASYQKFVARTPVPAADNAEKQAEEIGQFYRAFVLAFLEAEAPDGREMLTFLRDRHEQAVAGA